MLKIVINSHCKSNIPLEHLLNSMKKLDKYSNFQIIICIGGYYNLINYQIETNENITYIKCNHNSIDYTGLITLMELYTNNVDNYYFYLHDTCTVGINFYNKLENINLKSISSIKINGPFSMNIGIYSQKIINNFNKFLLSKKNLIDSESIKFKAFGEEDYIFNNDSNNKVLDQFDSWWTCIDGPLDYYKTGTMRIVEYYPNIDLYKIKANWCYKSNPNDWILHV